MPGILHKDSSPRIFNCFQSRIALYECLNKIKRFELSRGYLDFVSDFSQYREAEKKWYVELLSSTYTWFDAVIDPFPGFDVADMARKRLQELREGVKNSLDKHFVYYLVSRVRVRFSTKKKPRYAIFSKNLILYLEIGRGRRLKKCTVALRSWNLKAVIMPKVEVTDRYITIHNGVGGKISMSVYDFLDAFGIETGINSEVQYVGYTRNPADRPLDRSHRGFGDMLHWTTRGDEDYDYFIFHNLFKVLAVTSDPNAMFNFVVANAMTDEVGVKDEGLVLEKALIKYFGTKPQELNKKRELSELNNRLEVLAARHRISSITFDLSMERESEMFRFFSREVEVADRHYFTCQIGNSGAEIISAS